MKLIRIFVLIFMTSACAPLSHYQQYSSGTRINHPGVSFVLPGDYSWVILVGSTYQITLGAKGHNNNETIVASVSSYGLPVFSSNEEFFEFVKSGRSSEPQTGRFETIKNEETMYKERQETCVKHHMLSKDFGAKRGGNYTLIEYIGMNCIHPKNPKVGIFVELSRKAPPEVENLNFENLGLSLLQSVEFKDYF